MRAKQLLALAALAAVLTLCTGKPGDRVVPSDASCRAKYQALGETEILGRLTPCQGGATTQCCEAGQNLMGFNDQAPLAGCLCNEGLLEGILKTVEDNALARSAGVDRKLITGLLQQCSAPFAGGTGGSKCPSSQATAPAPAPAAAAAPSPAVPAAPAPPIPAAPALAPAVPAAPPAVAPRTTPASPAAPTAIPVPVPPPLPNPPSPPNPNPPPSSPAATPAATPASSSTSSSDPAPSPPATTETPPASAYPDDPESTTPPPVSDEATVQHPFVKGAYVAGSALAALKAARDNARNAAFEHIKQGLGLGGN